MRSIPRSSSLRRGRNAMQYLHPQDNSTWWRYNLQVPWRCGDRKGPDRRRREWSWPSKVHGRTRRWDPLHHLRCSEGVHVNLIIYFHIEIIDFYSFIICCFKLKSNEKKILCLTVLSSTTLQAKSQCHVRLHRGHNTPSPDSVFLQKSSLTSILLIINQSLTIFIRVWMC